MNASLPRRLLGWTVGALALITAHAAAGQSYFGLGRLQGKGTFYLDWQDQDDKRSDTKYETILFQERLGLRTSGAWVFDPRVLTLNLGGSFGLSQEKDIHVTDSSLRVGNGELYDYNFEALLMTGRSYPITVFANRDETTLSQGFGGRSEVSFESRGGIFELREDSALTDYGLLNFSSSLDVHQELLNEDSSVFGTPFRRDETHNIVRYRAHKGGETSDFDLRYEFNDVSDPRNAASVFDSHNLRALHSIDFGPTLNRRLDSSLYFFDRTGSAPGSYLALDEGLRLDHQRDFTTDYRYNFSRSDSDVGLTTTHNGHVGLLRRYYGSLTTTLQARGTRQDFPSGGKSVYGGQGGFSYVRSLPWWKGQAFADSHLGFQVDDNSFSSSSLDVVDEPHTAPSVFGSGSGFTLDNAFVVQETVVVVDVRNGARLPTTVNVDYTLSQEGNRTRVIPLVTSPVIRPNDPLEVSYQFSVDPSLEYSTTTLNARLGVDFPWFMFAYEHVLSDQARLSGTASPQFLIDQNLDRLTLELRGRWQDVQANSSVTYELLRSSIVDSNAWRLSQSLSYQPLAELTARISGDQYFVSYPDDNRRSRSYLVRGTVDWFPAAGLSVSPFGGYRAFDDTGIDSDEILDAGVMTRWTHRDIEVSSSVKWTDYRSRLSDVRGELRITRHLF